MGNLAIWVQVYDLILFINFVIRHHPRLNFKLWHPDILA